MQPQWRGFDLQHRDFTNFFPLLRPLILRQTRCRARSSGGVYNCRDENAYGTQGGGSGSGSSYGGGIVPKVCKYIQ